MAAVIPAGDRRPVPYLTRSSPARIAFYEKILADMDFTGADLTGQVTGKRTSPARLDARRQLMPPETRKPVIRDNDPLSLVSRPSSCGNTQAAKPDSWRTISDSAASLQHEGALSPASVYWQVPDDAMPL
jgi:hypothetical protein